MTRSAAAGREDHHHGQQGGPAPVVLATAGGDLPDDESEDLDGDGFAQSEDCDDSDASANPMQTELCNDKVDNDCDGFVDDFDNDCIGSAGDKSCAVVDLRSHIWSHLWFV